MALALLAPPGLLVLQALQALQARVALALLVLPGPLVLQALPPQFLAPQALQARLEALLALLGLQGLRAPVVQLCPLAQLAMPSLAMAQQRLLSKVSCSLEQVRSPALGRIRRLILLA